MKVSGEAGMRQGTVESWSERAREITLGWKPEYVWNPENVWNMDETGSFWCALPERALVKKESVAVVAKKKSKTAKYMGFLC